MELTCTLVYKGVVHCCTMVCRVFTDQHINFVQHINNLHLHYFFAGWPNSSLTSYPGLIIIEISSKPISISYDHIVRVHWMHLLAYLQKNVDDRLISNYSLYILHMVWILDYFFWLRFVLCQLFKAITKICRICIRMIHILSKRTKECKCGCYGTV